MKHLIWKKRNQKSFVRGLFCTTLSALMICTLVSQLTNVQAATYTFQKPASTVLKPICLYGNFEQPACSVEDAKKQSYVYYDATNTPARWFYYDDNNVPIWKTIAVNSDDRTKPAAHSIQFCVNPYDGTAPSLGNQYVELNTDFASRLYQDVSTVPGTKLYWSFAHAAYTSAGPDKMNFVLRPSGNAANPAIANQIQATATTYYNGTGTAISGTGATVTVMPQTNGRWVVYSGEYTVPAGQTSTSLELVAIAAGSGDSWHGNLVDDVKFQTPSNLITEKAITNSSGQRIDGGYGEFGDTVTVTMKITNWGETDAAPCVMTDTLWDGLQFVPGSGKVDGVASDNVSFNSSNSTVTANIGAGATAGAGGTIQGSWFMGTSDTTGKGQSVTVTYQAKITGAPGSTIKNQAKVTYNDKGYASYNPDGLTSYSTVDYGIANANYLGVAGHATTPMKMLNDDGTTRVTYDHTDVSNPETYVNQFTVADREVDGKVWFDRNENGKIDSGELGVDTVVKMQKLGSDGTTWTDAADWSGAALTMETTNTGGVYTFKGILPGRYRVLARIGAGKARSVMLKSSTLPTEVTTTTGTQGNYDNDADAATITDSGNNTWAVVQTLDKTTMAYTPAVSTYYTHNVDFGRVPVATIAKGCQIISSGNTDSGSSGDPVTVTYGDTMKYTLTVTNENNSGWMNIDAGMISVTDTLPDGLTYVSSSVTPTTVSGQNLTWSGLPSIPSGTSYAITVTARVTKPNIDIFNTAQTQEPDGMNTSSNTTYHHSKGLTLTIYKQVTGDLADPQKEFNFNVTLGGSQDSLLSGLGTTSSSYTYRDELNNTDLSGGGTLTFGNTVGSVSLKHGQSVTLHDLPMGINYTINETDNAGYTTTLSITNDTSNTGGTENTSTVSNTSVSGTLNNNNAKVDYSNTKTSAPLTGIILEFWPYILAMILVISIGTGLIIHHTHTKKHAGRHEGRHRDTHDDNEGL
ncbi:exported protein of unknown function [Ruminococcaceae bacterium BL-4]|nr:exported protein of unknown function [Ruminococcaceae bacterium BL-4]